jgi:uncharacterized protein
VRRGPVAEAAIAAIKRYRRWGSRSRAGRCRFTPSCSSFALEAFENRTAFVAAASVAWRVLRCNPLARSVAPDPVRRRRHLRPNAGPTAAALLSAAALVWLISLGSASAQTASGGCASTINGQSPTKLTRSNPLVVGANSMVVIAGQVPPKHKDPRKVKATTAIQVTGIEGIGGVTVKKLTTTGAAWGGRVKIDPYFRFGVGLYRVEVVAAGTGGWTCRMTAYVRLKGSPLSKPIGRGALVALGLGMAGALVSTKANTLRKPAGTWDKATDVFADAACLIITVLIFYSLVTFGAVLSATAAAEAKPKPKLVRRWGHGHTGLGFFSGFIAGAGATVLAQQYAVWPLTMTTGIGLPLAFGGLAAARAYLGRPYKVQAKAS